MHRALRGACTLAESRIATLYTEGLNRFVTSSIAPIATGWSDRCRVGLTPTEDRRLVTAYGTPYLIIGFGS